MGYRSLGRIVTLVGSCLLLTLPGLGRLTPESARKQAEEFIADVARYSLADPLAPSSMPEWAQGRVGHPVLVHGYADLRGRYYLVPVLDRQGVVTSLVSLDADSGRWQFYRRLPPARSLLPVGRGEAVEILRGEYGLEVGPESLLLVMMPNKRLYWYTRVASPDFQQEYFVSARDGFEVHDGAGREEAGLTTSFHGADLPVPGPLPPRDRTAGESRYPPDHEIENVPHHYQITPYYCCPASVEMVFDYWGTDVNQVDIAHVANSNQYFGTTSSDTVRSAHFSEISTAFQDPDLHGYAERGLGYGSLENRWSYPDEASDPDFPDRYADLKNLLAAGYPIAIATWYDTTYQEGHVRVLKGYNDTTDIFIVHDSWDGPDLYFNQALLVDDLWTQNSRWGLHASPWEVQLSPPATICGGDHFSLDVAVDYRGPHPFEGQDPARETQATIVLPEGFALEDGEPETRALPDLDRSGSSDTVAWEIVAPLGATTGTVTVEAIGLIDDASFSYPAYTDRIGGVGTRLLEVLPVPGGCTGLHLQGDRETIVWLPVPGADSYDLISGDLSLLHAHEGDFAASLLGCVENDSPDTTARDTASPGTGQGFYYLVRAVGPCGAGSYNSGHPAQSGDRDPGIASSPDRCL